MTNESQIKLGYVFIFASFLMLAYAVYQLSPFSRQSQPFSSYALLSSSWEKYKSQFINSDGRVIDYSQNETTSSEGQSYAMLRAVWMGDKDEFDLVWKWTKDNLQKRGTDSLFGWRWGKRPGGAYGFMPSGGDNSASDADSDIALALILASSRWKNDAYLSEAKKIIPSIWDNETSVISGKRYLIAGSWAKGQDRIIVNLSYLSPYAWREFAKVDSGHDWNSLITPAYDLLDKSTKANLGVPGKLPPDWIAIRVPSGEIVSAASEGLSSNFGYDAERIPWRIALDYLWNNEGRAYSYLHGLFDFFAAQYRTEKNLSSVYTHDGKPASSFESPLTYSALIGMFKIFDPGLAEQVYEEKIIKLYSSDSNTFKSDIPYYEQNWLWFGAALYHGRVTNY